VAGEKIAVELRPTGVLTPLLTAAHFTAAITLSVTFSMGWPLALGWLLLAASAVWSLRRSRAVNRAGRLELTAERECRWQHGPRKTEGRLRPDTTVFSRLIVLRCDLPNGRGVRSLLLFRDALQSDDWRRLSIFLRWGVRFAGVSAQSAELS
jgi:Membrane-bound toxin component of toxin-antitoxin system